MSHSIEKCLFPFTFKSLAIERHRCFTVVQCGGSTFVREARQQKNCHTYFKMYTRWTIQTTNVADFRDVFSRFCLCVYHFYNHRMVLVRKAFRTTRSSRLRQMLQHITRHATQAQATTKTNTPEKAHKIQWFCFRSEVFSWRMSSPSGATKMVLLLLLLFSGVFSALLVFLWNLCCCHWLFCRLTWCYAIHNSTTGFSGIIPEVVVALFDLRLL